MPVDAAPLKLPLWAYPLVVLVVVLAAYAGDVGRGFVKEDATWILTSRVGSLADLERAFTQTAGFFRPIVTLSFAVSFPIFGANPAGYGWTNLLIAIASAAAIARLASLLRLSAGAGILAGSLWILNFHGINAAVLWLSGRTALLLVLFSVLAAIAAARNRVVLAAVLSLLAMASKEEGVLLPSILLALVALQPGAPPGRGRLGAMAVAMALVWTAYGALRLRSNAYTPFEAPVFYTFMAPPWSLSKNLAEYADRALTFPLAVTLLALVVGGQRPRIDTDGLKLLVLSSAWLAFGFALTILLPVRSSLYVLFPSVGAALAAATVIDRVWPAIPVPRQRRLAVAALLIPLLLIPVYRLRNQRWTELGDVSREVVAALASLSREAPSPWRVVVVDDETSRANVRAALWNAVPDAVELTSGKRPHVWLIPPPGDLDAHEYDTTPARPDVVIALRKGRIVRLPDTAVTPTIAFRMH